MPSILANYIDNTDTFVSVGNYHALTDTNEQVSQISFFKSGRADLANNEFIEVDKPALVTLKEF